MQGHAYQPSDITNDLLQCTICFESFKEPKVLRCQHTFCLPCLQNYWQQYSQTYTQNNQTIPCPTCRHMTTLPRNGMAGLPNDFKVSKIEDLVHRLATTEEHRQRNEATLVTKKCDICRSIHQEGTARFYCNDCEKNLCDVCASRHSEVLLFKQHNVIYINQPLPMPATDGCCQRHTSERAKYLCTFCTTSVCTVCVMESHGDHEVMDLDKGVAYLKQKLDQTIKLISPNMDQTRNTVHMLRSLVDTQKEHFDKAITTIKDRTLEIIKQAKQCEKELVHVMQENHTKSLHEAEQQLHDIMSKSYNHETGLRAIQNEIDNSNMLNFLNNYKVTEKKASLLLQETSATLPDNPKVLVKFVANIEPIRHGTLQYMNYIPPDIQTPKQERSDYQRASGERHCKNRPMMMSREPADKTQQDLPERDINVSQEQFVNIKKKKVPTATLR